MKSIFNYLAAAAVVLATGTVVFQACKKPTEGVDVTVSTDALYTTPMIFHFANANSAASNQPGTFDVTITGQDAASIVTPEGKKTFKAQDGLLTLMVTRSTAPSAAKPVKFSLTANVNGFTPVVQNVTVTTDSAYSQEVNLVEYANPAPGTAVKVHTATLTAGSTPATETTVATTTTTTTTETASVTFPASTKFKGENGQEITSGNLSANIVYFGTTNESSLNAFPGGFSANNILGQNGQPIQEGATFVTAGFLSVNMKVGNTDVKSFTKPLKVKMDINSNLDNPATGAKVKAGDVIPVWSLDEKTGQWKWEANGTVAASGGKLYMEYEMAHLSSWNIDWAYYNNPGIPVCNKTTTVVVKNAGSTFSGQVYLANSTGQKLTSYAGGNVSVGNGNRTFTFSGNTPSTNIKVIVANQAGVKVAESALFNPCTTNSAVEVNVPAAATPTAYINLTLKGRCTNKNVQVVVNNTAKINRWNPATNSYVYLTAVSLIKGAASFSLQENTKYRVDAVYNGKTYSSEMELKGASFIFSSVSTSAKLSGKATYDGTTKTYTATGEISLVCN